MTPTDRDRPPVAIAPPAQRGFHDQERPPSVASWLLPVLPLGTGLSGLGPWLTPRQAYAEALGIVQTIQAEAAKTPITIHRLRGNVAVLEGSGGNVAVLTGPDGKVMVEAGIAVSRPQMEKALATLGPEPVTHLINTHWHFDHANGNAWLHELGPQILAHENTRKHLMTMQRVEDWDYDFAPLPAAALPDRAVRR